MNSAIRTSLSQFALESSLFTRNRITVFWTFLFPVMIIAILGYSFGAGRFGRNDYVEVLMGGIIGTNVMAMALFNIGANLSEYRERGLFQRIAVSRASLGAALTGLVFHRYVVVTVQIAIMVLVAHLMFGYQLPAARVAFVLTLALGIVNFTALGFLFALLVRSATEALALSNMLYLPLAFLSGAYFPVDNLPGAFLLRDLPSASLIASLRIAATAPEGMWKSAPVITLLAWTVFFVVSASVLRARLSWNSR